ncbi:MAG: hypothetical protein JWQ88_1346, partial [Rhodoferax sp.]|nr:hypothetical protein [Rhodoferax sp.]
QIADLRRIDVKEKAEEYNLDLNNPEDRLIAAEEVLAEWAQRRPELGYVKRAIAVLRHWLRKIPGFRNMRMTDDEIVANFLIPARGWVENGGPGRGPRGGAPKPGGDSRYSMEGSHQSALSELSKADDLFALPKSTQDTLAGIVAVNDPQIKVRETKFPGNETMYTMTMANGGTARLTVRKSGPTSVYGAEVQDDNSYDWLQGRPGENPDDVDPAKEDVWIDVSMLKPGENGALVYNIAATFAHNTNRIFIGDPAGLSDEAMRRRSEQMLSSALKFGTTAHLAPHPRQVEGDRKIGVPALRWVYGDHEGNIERLIDLNVQALDNALPESKIIAYDPVKQSFYRTDTGATLQRGQLAFVVGQSVDRRPGMDGRAGRTGQAGWRTIARAALFRQLQATRDAAAGGGRGSVLDLLRVQRPGLQGGRDHEANSGREGRIFYSRASRTDDSDSLKGSPASAAGVNNIRNYGVQAAQQVRDLFQAPGNVNWWHKTVGTMHNLSKRSPQFGKVFDAVQNFLGDVSAFATEAADLAPTLLPKLENWRDIGKSPISAEDTKAVAAPIFEGTLTWARDDGGKLVPLAEVEAKYADLSDQQKGQLLLRKGAVTAQQLQTWQASRLDIYSGAVNSRFDATFLKAGVVFTDAELAAQFKLTPAQIGLYREFRAATDQSLNTMTISEMLRFGGKDVEGMREMAMAAGTAREAGILLRDFLLDAAVEQPERNSLLIDTANRMIEKADKVQGLIDHGYAPLSRFGHYTVDVLDEQGDRAFFGMFESKAQANLMARKMRQNFPVGTITQGTVSEQAYKLFSGITPETLELFGEMVGLEPEGDGAQHQMFQEYLKLAKANRSAMKRLIHRKGIAGFSEDAGRVLAGFIYSNARLTSTNLHAGTINKATADISKTDGELKDMAVKLADYVRNPQEEAQALRGMMFAQYLGGSLASAMVNMTQPFAVTMPYLSQWGGAIKAAGRMRGAVADALKDSTGDARLDSALKQAADEGIVAPQEVHQLMAQARGRGALQAGDGTIAGNLRADASNVISKMSLAWGKPFAAAEQFNRRVTFIAAWRTAMGEGIANPAKFAEEAIRDTQFVYNKGNKPQWARGAIGATLFTFKQYSVSYAELMHRMYTQGGPDGKRAVLFAMAMLLLMGGSGGLPFMADAEDVVDGIMQRLGYSFSTKQVRRQFFIDALGEGGANFVEHGLSGLPGVPI